jgi:hypothetical protein
MKQKRMYIFLIAFTLMAVSALGISVLAARF